MKRSNFTRLRSGSKVFIVGVILLVVLWNLSEFLDRGDLIFRIGPTPIRRIEIDPRQLRWMDNSTRYNYVFSVIYEPRKKSCPTNFYVVVPSAPNNMERRMAIRETWAKDILSKGDSRLLFTLGKSNDITLTSQLAYEREKYDDMVVFDFEDSYDNSTLKSILSVNYVAACRPTYFLKADDDTYVNVERLSESLEVVEEDFKEPFVAGQVYARAEPHRIFTKWTVDRDEYPELFYPPFISGNLYVMSGSLLPAVAGTAFHTRFLHLEDVFMTGLVASKLMIPRVSLEGTWDLRRLTTYNCAYDRLISGHYVDASLMRQIHEDRRTFFQSCTSFFLISWCSCVPKIAEIYL